MELSPHLRRLAADLEKVTALADEPTREVAARLATALEPSLRMALVEAVTETAALVTAHLDDVVVTVRMDGRDPVVVIEQTSPEATAPIPTPEPDEDDDARVTLRLPQSLKRRAEKRAEEADQSLNSWIVHAIRRAAQGEPGPTNPFSPTSRHTPRRVTGWA